MADATGVRHFICVSRIPGKLFVQTEIPQDQPIQLSATAVNPGDLVTAVTKE